MEASLVVAGVTDVTEGVKNMVKVDENEKLVVVACNGGEGKIAATESKKQSKNRIKVSNTKRPFIYYVVLAKKYIKQYKAVELSALGMAIPTVVRVSEFLKRKGLAVEKKISLSTVSTKEDEKGRVVEKAQIAIVLESAAELAETSVEIPSKDC
ncbi:hypothetical protein FNV43_RR01513 [Rhamnella rubrinervis]|uniref:DNA/RNA-binding protein Alba-like domain-containing protein n=1 Tax=Rhamnella rubrinervis TaxID=2594499 RepID=A0A8K0MSX7_9ROSA|nr:hypothetical protein FNV43_RR01513 [Rhamnella rubrinervis]